MDSRFKKIFSILGFSEDETQKSLAELNSLIAARIVASFMDELKPSEAEEVKNRLEAAKEVRGAQEIVADILQKRYQKEEIDLRMSSIVGDVIAEYFAVILSSVGASQRDAILEALSA